MNQSISIFLFLIVCGLFASCIRDYEPDILVKDERKYVIHGRVVLGDSLQTVNVSQSSSINSPVYHPIIGCTARIIDNEGNVFALDDFLDGNYSGKIDTAFLRPGSAFKVEIMTPTGDLLESDFDTITSSPGLDTVYYEREDIEYNQVSAPRMGIRFYADFHGSDQDSRYYRWEAIETWEYHAQYPLEWYYNGTVHHVYPPDYSKNVCWATKRVPDHFLLSTEDLQENRYVGFPLHFVDNLTSRLAYGYSVLVRQFSLSKAAYTYYEQLRTNTNPEGGLYDQQPLVVVGNIHNRTHPEDAVLGFFSTGSVSTKRIFVKDVPDLTLNFYNDCSTTELRLGLKQITSNLYPAYLEGDQFNYKPSLLDKTCVDCTASGGSLTKPAFWPY